MPTTTLPQSKEKAAEISRKITNSRPLKRDKDAPEQQVTGGFNQKSHPETADRPKPEENSATEGDGQGARPRTTTTRPMIASGRTR